MTFQQYETSTLEGEYFSSLLVGFQTVGSKIELNITRC